MGKVRRARQKAHTAAVKVKTGGDKTSQKDDTQTMDTDQGVTLPELTNPADSTGDIFSSLDLGKYKLTTKLPTDLDAQSSITSKSLKELKMKKKDKQKLRHDLWIKKLSAIDAAKKNAADKKKKQQTPVVGDIGVLGEALPTLELLMKQPKVVGEPTKKLRGIQKEKKRRKQMLDDISVFQKVLEHPSYRDNPVATISEHLHNRQKLEDAQS